MSLVSIKHKLSSGDIMKFGLIENILVFLVYRLLESLRSKVLKDFIAFKFVLLLYYTNCVEVTFS